MDMGCNLNRDCPQAGLTSQPPEKYNACTIKQQAPEPVDGCEYTQGISTHSCWQDWLTNLTAYHRAQGNAHGPNGHQGLSGCLRMFWEVIIDRLLPGLPAGSERILFYCSASLSWIQWQETQAAGVGLDL
jgi:hypothetical protein